MTLKTRVMEAVQWARLFSFLDCQVRRAHFLLQDTTLTPRHPL